MIPYKDENTFSVITAAVYSYWLVEHNADGDLDKARRIANEAIELANTRGSFNRLTQLYSSVARCSVRCGDMAAAQQALEQARLAVDRTEPSYRLFLALAAAEVLAEINPMRSVVLNQARARILRIAERREDPYAYCTEVRLNRRLLELSGGVPTDLPRRPLPAVAH